MTTESKKVVVVGEQPDLVNALKDKLGDDVVLNTKESMEERIAISDDRTMVATNHLLHIVAGTTVDDIIDDVMRKPCDLNKPSRFDISVSKQIPERKAPKRKFKRNKKRGY